MRTSWSTSFCPLSQLRKEILDDKSISPEVQDYFFQLAGMNILRAARLLTLDNDNQQLRMKISNPNGPNAQITKRNGWLVRGICSLEQK